MTASSHRKSAATAQQGIKRQFELVLLILLLSLIVWAFLDKTREVRSAAEFSAVQANLGALRTAMAVDRMHRAVKSGGAQAKAASAANPFLLLARPPTNYVGVHPLGDALAGVVPQGFWFYDQVDALVGYRLMDGRGFRGGSTGDVLVFHRAEPELLLAREPYIWRGETVK